jgi:hypothetical protein
LASFLKNTAVLRAPNALTGQVGSLLAAAFSTLTLAALFAITPALAEEGYYKWTDAKGNPHHSDRPPPAGVEYEFVSTGSGLKRRVSAGASDGRDYGSGAPAMPAPADDEPTEADRQAAIEKDPALCEQARGNLQTLNGMVRVRIRDDNGIRWLTDEEKEFQRQRAQDLIEIHCN